MPRFTRRFSLIDTSTTVSIPLMASRASAGFPSPADDFIEDRIDLNEMLVRNSVATFLWRVAGDSMVDARIFHDDVIVVDRSLSPNNRDIVLVAVEGEPSVKRMLKRNGLVRFVWENRTYPEFALTEIADVQVWGVVTWTLRGLRP